MQLPAGWDGAISRRPNAPAVVHAASFALPPADGDFATAATSAMPPDGVVVVLVEYDPQLAGTGLFAPAGPPVKLEAADFSSSTLLRRLPGQVGVQRFFTHRGRAFCLYVVLGSEHAAAQLAARATAVLATLSLT
jgi:hypothetical protein